MRVHAVTGSPGTGKHAAAAAACRQAGLRAVDLGEAAAGLGLCEYDASDGTSDVDVRALAGALFRGGGGGGALLSDGCVAVGHLAPYVIPPDRAGTIVVLRRSPYELEEVYARRGYGAAKAADNLGAEILGVVAHDAARLAAGGGGAAVAQVDTTGSTVRETARAVAGLLQLRGGRGAAGRGRGWGAGGIDWLALVAERGDLQRFFPAAGKLT